MLSPRAPCLPLLNRMLAPNYLDLTITIDGFQHREEDFVLKAMAIVSHHTQWTKTYNSDFLLKQPKANLITYHRQTALHGHPQLKYGAAQFSAPKHLLTPCAVCNTTGWTPRRCLYQPFISGQRASRIATSWKCYYLRVHELTIWMTSLTPPSRRLPCLLSTRNSKHWPRPLLWPLDSKQNTNPKSGSRTTGRHSKHYYLKLFHLFFLNFLNS